MSLEFLLLRQPWTEARWKTFSPVFGLCAKNCNRGSLDRKYVLNHLNLKSFQQGGLGKPWTDVNKAFVCWIDDKFGEFRTERRANCTQANLQINILEM